MTSLSSPTLVGPISMPPYDRHAPTSIAGSSVGKSANTSEQMMIRAPSSRRHHLSEEPAPLHPKIVIPSISSSFGGSISAHCNAYTDSPGAPSAGIRKSAHRTASTNTTMRLPSLHSPLQGHKSFPARKTSGSTMITTCATCLIGLEVPTVNIAQPVLCVSCRASRGLRASRPRPSVMPNLDFHMLKSPLAPNPFSNATIRSPSSSSEMSWERPKVVGMEVDGSLNQPTNMHANPEPEQLLIIDLTYPDEEPVSDVPIRTDDLAVSSPKSIEAPDQARVSVNPTSPITSRSRRGEQPCETPNCVRTVPSGFTWSKCTVCTLARWDTIRGIKHQPAPPAVPSEPARAPEAISKREHLSPTAGMLWETDTSSTVAPGESSSPAPTVGRIGSEGRSSSPEVLLRLQVSRSSFTSPASSTSISSHDRNVSISAWDSDLTDLTSNDGSESELDDDKVSRHNTGIKIRIPVFAKVGSSRALLRICAMRKCNVVLPANHQWKVCDPCRRHHRAYQRLRLERLRRRALESSEDDDLDGNDDGHKLKFKLTRNRRSSSPTSAEDFLGPSGPDTRRCNYSYCARPLPSDDQYRFKLCPSCRARARRNTQRRRDDVEDAIFAPDPSEEDKKEGKTMVRYEAFLNMSTLFAAFKVRLEEFVHAHVLYLRAKLRELVILSRGKDKDRVAMMMHEQRARAMFFAFNGEYSSVFPECEQDGKSGRSIVRGFRDAEGIQRELRGLARRVGEMLHTEFSPTATFSVEDGGFIMRYTSELDLVLPCEVMAPPTEEFIAEGAREVRPFVKRLRNELEVAIVPDQSHKYFMGRRTVLCFRLLG